MKVRFAVSVGLGRPDPVALAALFRSAEGLGFDSLWFPDVPMLRVTDPFLAVAFAAASTSRMRLGVDLVPFGYEPFVFARKLAELDHLTGGRLLVTLVPGLDLPGERAALGIVGVHRGHRMDELLPLLRAWWSGDAVVPRPGAEPVALPILPRQDPLEIWLGGSGPLAIERSGRLSDGWLGSLSTPEDTGDIRARIQAAAHDAGRTIDPEHFGLSIAYARTEQDLEEAASRRPRTAGRPAGRDPAGRDPAGRGLAATTGPGPHGRRGRADDDVAALVPVGADALRALVGRHVDVGISKFVIRPLVAPASWPDELGWLADTVLPLQT